MNQKNLHNVDWSKIPKPLEDVKLDHLNNFLIKKIHLSNILMFFIFFQIINMSFMLKARKK